MVELILKEETWLLLTTSAGIIAALVALQRGWKRPIPRKLRAAAALSAFFGLAMGIGGVGHLIGVTTKLLLGTLPPNIHLWLAIPLGFALAVPGWWLLALVGRLHREDSAAKKKAIWLHSWLAAVLLVPAGPLLVFPALSIVLLLLSGTPRPAAASAAGTS